MKESLQTDFYSGNDDHRTIISKKENTYPGIGQLYIKKDTKEIGTASIVRMTIPYKLLDELHIDKDVLSHIFLILTCAHNVVYQESMADNHFRKANEIFIIIGKQ
jgi:hypothetical protein